MLDSNKSTNFNKNLILNQLIYVSYDMIQFIWYTLCIVLFMNIYDKPLQYKTSYTQYNTYRTIWIAYCIILTTILREFPPTILQSPFKFDCLLLMPATNVRPFSRSSHNAATHTPWASLVANVESISNNGI